MPEEFIAFLAPHCRYVKNRGYFPSVFLAQSILESGWGRSKLSNVLNYWGHTWRETDGDNFGFVSKDTLEESDGELIPTNRRFRVYLTMAEAIKAYCDKWEEVWPGTSRMKYPEKDFRSPTAFIQSVAPIYATDSQYADKIIAIIEEWGLNEYDV